MDGDISRFIYQESKNVLQNTTCRENRPYIVDQNTSIGCEFMKCRPINRDHEFINTRCDNLCIYEKSEYAIKDIASIKARWQYIDKYKDE